MKLAFGYLALSLIAEIFSALGLFIPGALIHGMYILVVFSWYGIRGAASLPDLPRLPLVLGLVSLMRFISLTLPLELVPPVVWPALIALPLLIAMLIMARRLELSAKRLRLPLQATPKQVWIALSGIPLGLEGYLILRPTVLLPEVSAFELIAGFLLLMFGVGITEELLFRGFLLTIAEEEHSRLGLILSSILFGVMLLSSGSLAYAVFMMFVGWFFCECVSRTRSLWGVVLAHTLIAAGMGLFWPLMF